MKALPLFLTLLLTTAMAFVPRSTSTASRLQNHPFSPGPLFGVFERLSGTAAELRGAVEFFNALTSASEDGNITKEELITLNSALEELITLDSALGKFIDIQKGTGEVVVQASSNPVIPIIQKVLTDSVDAEFKSEREGLEYDTYPEHPEFPDVTLESMMKMVKGVPPLRYFFSPSKIFRLFTRSIILNLGFMLTNQNVENAKTHEKKYEAMFTDSTIWGWIPNPFDLVPKPVHVIHNWDDDEEFARQFMNGVNPLMISVVKDPETQLTKNLLDFFQADDKGVNLRALAHDKRLLYVSYNDLAELEVNPHQAYPSPPNEGVPPTEPRYFDAPMIVFKLSRNREKLKILAIQLDRDPNAEVYSKQTTDKTTWLMAKTSVANADSQIHEWVSHLGRTHLTIEPMLVAIHNTLQKEKHKIYPFLKPMTRDTLFINWAARRTLASYQKDSFGDYTSSVGVGQFMQLIKKYWSQYKFFKDSHLLNELESRGFDKDFDMPCYLYREDGRKIWEAYGNFARNFTDATYVSDAAVKADKGLQRWAKEMTQKACVPGFPDHFEEKETLALTLQTLGWISVQHAAVNFPQYDYYTFSPNKPLGIRNGMVEFQRDSGGERDWIFANVYAYVEDEKGEKAKNAQEVVQIARALTMPSKNCLNNLRKDFQGTTAEEPYLKFQSDLKVIGDAINKRNKKNKKRGEATYHYLHPSVIPASVDI